MAAHRQKAAPNEGILHRGRLARLAIWSALGGAALALSLAACGGSTDVGNLDAIDVVDAEADAGLTTADDAAAPVEDGSSGDAADARPNECEDDGGTITCGKGECVRTVPACVGGRIQTCTPKEPSAETCDGLDNDCDGEIDEDVAELTCGVGTCKTTVPGCLPGGVTNTCTPGAPGPKTCGLDNDCDGVMDETGPMMMPGTPVSVRGFNVDAIAEMKPAATTTSSSLDLTAHVLYTQTYAAVAGIAGGLPNSGTILANGRQYQLAPFDKSNMLKLGAGQEGTLSLVTPASFASVSILGFATEGSTGVSVTLEYSDGSKDLSTASLRDWYNGTPSIIYGFGRVSRTDDAEPSFNNPKMYAIDVNLSCAARTKVLKSISFKNLSLNPAPNVVIVAVSAGQP
ncbi:Hypothetical protein AKJ09_02389 [Labilithrix luteola]|uniref:Uncharacterized protein n=1 Tax=Labilithrix luteola TaxID=1391654 RepID=A0A0K1PQB0_9BACT|nr:Hypothetical protein AKJ09_02389 [Labilithrix luteola]